MKVKIHINWHWCNCGRHVKAILVYEGAADILLADSALGHCI